MRVTVDTSKFELVHGREPAGDGLWLFKNTFGELLERTGRYASVRRALPYGHYRLLP